MFEDISTDKTRKQSSGALGSSNLTAGQEATVDNPESQEMVDQLKIRITELEKQLSNSQFTTAVSQYYVLCNVLCIGTYAVT